MEQEIINWLIGGFGATIGFLVRALWTDVKSLSDKVAAVDVLVAGSYIRRDEFDRIMTRVFEKLDTIEHKVTSKHD